MTCPQCTSSDIRRSTTSSWSDILPSLRGRRAFRCRKCRQRFYAARLTAPAVHGSDHSGRKIAASKLGKKWMRQRLIRGVIAAGVIVAMFSIFGLFLHYIAVDHPPKDSAQDMGSPNQ